MDSSHFFDYPDGAAPKASTGDLIFLPQATKADWERLIGFCTLQPFHAGDVVIRQDDKQQALYIVVRGELEVVFEDRSTNTLRSLATIPEGSVFGEQAFFDGEPRSASVRARGEGEMLELTLESFEVLAGQAPSLGRAVLFDLARILSLRLRHTTEVAIAATR